MKRITVEMVKEAYAKTGLKPKNQCFFDNGCACAIGAMYYEKTGSAAGGFARGWADEMFTDIYADGFIYGFDEQYPAWQDNPYYMQGYEDGRAAWEAVKCSHE